MKRLHTLVAALAVWLALSTCTSAQDACQPCPAGATSVGRCPAGTLEKCPAEVCGGWDRLLNCRKHLTCVPAGSELQQYTLDDIKKLPYPQSWHGGKDRAELAGLGEGRHVSVTARLYRAELAMPDFANCRLDGPQDRDVLMLLVPEGALKKKQTGPQREALSVMATLRPRERRAHKNWTLDSLGRLSNKGPVYVRVTGLLLLDTAGPFAHVERGKPRRVELLPRATDWVIHPVLELEVCLTKRCYEEGRWKPLDDVDVPPWPRGVTESGRDQDIESDDTGPVIVPRRKIYHKKPTPGRRARQRR